MKLTTRSRIRYIKCGMRGENGPDPTLILKIRRCFHSSGCISITSLQKEGIETLGARCTWHSRLQLLKTPHLHDAVTECN